MANIAPDRDTVRPWGRSRNDGQEDGLIDQDDLQANSFENPNRNDNDNITSSEANSTQPVKYTSQLASLFIIVNVTVGVGLLAMPAAMQAAGLLTSLIIQVMFLLLIMTTCIMCTELTIQTGVDSYHKIVKVHCHPFVYQFTQVSILMLVFGTSVAYIVIIGDQADRIFASLYGPTFCASWYMNRRFIMSASTVFIIKPLCSAKTVDFLKYGSFLGIASIGFIIYVVISEFTKIAHIPDTVNYLPKKFLDIGSVLPVFCFAYQCHLSWVPTVASVRREEKRKSYVTISIAMFIATAIYAVVSILAILTFGSSILNDLTESYPGKEWPILTTIGIVAFKCLVTLPPAFLPARLSLVDILTGSSRTFASFSEQTKRYSVTFITLSVALMLALFVPDILVAVNILGSLAVMFVFTLPALSYLHLVKQNRVQKQQSMGLGDEPIYSVKDKIKLSMSYFIIVFGIFMTFVVLYKSITNIFASTSSPQLCKIP